MTHQVYRYMCSFTFKQFLISMLKWLCEYGEYGDRIFMCWLFSANDISFETVADEALNLTKRANI